MQISWSNETENSRKIAKGEDKTRKILRFTCRLLNKFK